MNDVKERMRAVFNELARDFLVPDLMTAESRVLFLLESPHVQEVKHGAPVSGSSGATMSKHLYGEPYAKYPLGLLLKQNRDRQLNRPSLSKVGLLNVCNIPLQGAAYGNRAVRERYGAFFRVLEGVRTENNRWDYPDPEWNAAQEIIADSLRRKLHKLVEREAVIIPCGRFAQKFFRLAGVQSQQWHVIDNVPHPSYDSWSRPQYAQVIQRVRQAFQADGLYTN